MAKKQKPHVRTSKKGKKFVAGRGKPKRKLVKKPSNSERELKQTELSVRNVMLVRRTFRYLQDFGELLFTVDGNYLIAEGLDSSTVMYSRTDIPFDSVSKQNVPSFKAETKPLYKAVRQFKASEPYKMRLAINIKDPRKAQSVVYNKDKKSFLDLRVADKDDLDTAKRYSEQMKDVEQKAKYVTQISMDRSRELVSFLREAKKQSDMIHLSAGPGGVSLYYKKGDDKKRFLADNTKRDKAFVANYSIKNLYYLLPIMKDALIEIRFAEDHPVVVNLSKNRLFTKFVLAPRVKYK